jgi:hypothetical protein
MLLIAELFSLFNRAVKNTIRVYKVLISKGYRSFLRINFRANIPALLSITSLLIIAKYRALKKSMQDAHSSLLKLDSSMVLTPTLSSKMLYYFSEPGIEHESSSSIAFSSAIISS